MQFSANLSMLFTEHPFLERFGQAARAGFRAAECLFPYEAGVEAIRAQLLEFELQLVLFNLPPGDQAAGDWGCLGLPGREDEYKRHFDQALKAAEVLGCDRLHALFGQRLPDVAAEAQIECALRNLSWSAPLAEEAGVIVMIEALNSKDFPAFFLSKPSMALDLVKQIDHEHIRLQYDVYHAQRTEGDLITTIQEALPWIGHIQIADVPGRHEPGTGEINYPRIFEALKKSEYRGFIGLEYRPFNDTISSLGWLQEACRGEREG